MTARPSARDARAVSLLLEGATLHETAAALGLSERQLRRVRARPAFRVLLAEAQRAVLSEARRRLAIATSTAVDVLLAVLLDVNAPAAVRASTAIRVVEMAHDLSATMDVDDRLAALEAAAQRRLDS